MLLLLDVAFKEIEGGFNICDECCKHALVFFYFGYVGRKSKPHNPFDIWKIDKE